MKATLIFIGISIIINQLSYIYEVVTGKWLEGVLDILVTGYPN